MCFSSYNHYYEKFEDGTVNDITEEIPFEIPSSWKWTRMVNVISYQNGYAYQKNEMSNSGFPIIKSGNLMTLEVVIKSNNDYIKNPTEKMLNSKIIKGDLLMCLSSQSNNPEPLGKTAIYKFDFPALLNQRVLKMQPFNIDITEYLYYVINSQYFHYTVSHFGGGSAQANLKLEHVLGMIIPIPPLNEQKEITNKIKKLFPYIEKYDKKQENLEILNTRYKDELKKSILQYAIQGKLVPQSLDDESAEVLINKILDEKRELIKTKQIKKENLSVIYRDDTDNQFYEKFDDGTIINITDEIPFEIPDNWKWCRLNTISYLITKGSSPSWQGVKYVEKSKESILFITSENVGKNKIIQNNLKYLEKKFNEIQPRSILKKDDILTNIVGASIGRSCIYNLEDENANINQAVCLIRLIKINLNKYILQYLNSPFCYKQMLNNTVETARPNISLTTIGNLFIPLPPENEQEKILIKLEELNKVLTAE